MSATDPTKYAPFSLEEFEPFERWMGEFTKAGKALPMLGARGFFREGYLAAIKAAGVRFGKPMRRVRRAKATQNEED